MAFIRKRLSSNDRFRGEQYSYQLIETYRKDGKVKQRVICNLHGRETVEQALKDAKEQLKEYQGIVARGVPIYGWSDETRTWRALRRSGRMEHTYAEWEQQQRADWLKSMASEVAYYEARVALLESVVSKNGNS